ncbi:MAG: beta-N-acetylglucosaminidase [Bacteroidetes bacterium B1(2017)]|nr:MAG: beta-N-acetylglucosaminidase [Bacteroidetes bacterium B1(2017)]
MRLITSLLISLFPLFSLSQGKKTILPLVPLPVEMNVGAGEFKLGETTLIYTPSEQIINEIVYFHSFIQTTYGIKLRAVKVKPKTGNYIEFRSNPEFKIPDGGYTLGITTNKVLLQATNGMGIFYGIQTLFQLLPVKGKGSLPLPCVQITDYPRYQWRGMHLDCSRHFFPVSFIKKYIDCIASYKMNVFHWHLTDDQGWRIEIKQFPLLTEIGAYRKGSMVGAYADNKFDSTRYGGFYTQEEIKDIVSYAQKKYVSIVPEIEMPGHALAAIAAYPELSCSGMPAEVGMKWGVETNVFCPSEHTFTFLDKVLNEVMDLFPGKYIHIGGDEVLKDEWNKSPICQEIIKSNNLKDAHELQSYFIKRIEQIVNARGRTIIGWDEILEGGLAPNAAVMSWRGVEGGIAAAKQKHEVVMSPGSHCYFDHYQGKPEGEPLAIGGFTPLEKVYSYEPTPDSLDMDEVHKILGAQGNVWTEYILSPQQVEYMSMPRMSALAEVLWTPPARKNYENFFERMRIHIKLLDVRGINYCKTAFKPSSK